MAKDLFANRLKKVVPFDQDGSFFYRKAKKYIENNNYINALNYYRKAIEKDPDNLEYSMDLAEVFSEMGYYHESNLILFYIMQKNPSRTECYFAIGCNFLGLQEFSKARDSLQKYLEADEYGFYAEEAQNLLEVLQSQEFFIENFNEADPVRDETLALATRGKDLLDKGDYRQAVRVLEKAAQRDPGLIFARNNLALAYFCIGKLDKAIEICLDILEEYPNNVHANCNIAFFLNEKGDSEASNKYIERVISIKTEDVDDLYKVAVTLCEMGQHRRVNQLLKKLLQYKPYDTKVLHYMAVSCYNLKMFKSAYKYWDKVEKINPNNTISSYYKHYVRSIMKNEREFTELPYHFQVPYDEIIRRVKTIHDLLKLPSVDLAEKWKNGNALDSLLRWGLDLNDVMIKKAILNVVASFRDEKAEQFLRAFVLRKTEGKEQIREALTLLKEMNAKEPYLAYVDDSIVEVSVNFNSTAGSGRDVIEAIPEMAIERIKSYYLVDCEDDIRDIWESVVTLWEKTGKPRIQKPEGWAAALELYYRIREGLPVSKTELAASWHVTYNTMMNNYNYINKLLAEFWEQMNW
ncbi:MAG TPA: tetratricopeptide repeat protein [Clostridiales bacterium]|nr:tetratricopeptide repeat protein [Clostridiales bacterium]